MKRILAVFVMVCLLSLGMAANLNATGAMGKEETVPCGMADLVGTQVKNPAGETLGSIDKFIFDRKGQPVLAVIYQGDLDDHDFPRYVAVPFGALSILETKPGEMTAILDLDREKLVSAPRFDRTKEPSKSQWGNIYRYYGQQPYWTQEESEKIAPAMVEPEEYYYP